VEGPLPLGQQALAQFLLKVSEQSLQTTHGDPMKKMNSLVAALLAVSSVSAFAQAAAPAAAPAPDWTITGNAGLFSDYRFRGISQTDKKAAFQGGFDVAHSSGFYLGNWNSNIDSSFFGGANIEMDFYGGFKGAVGDISYDVGALYYYYPGSDRSGTAKIKNTEVYVGASYGPVSAKVYYPISDFFSAEDLIGGGNAAGSYYLDLSGAYDLGNGFGLNAHVGYQKAKGAAKGLYAGESSVIDWKLGATYGLSNGFVLGLAYIDTDNDDIAGATGKKISKGTALLSLSKAF
jgi:uncharacterized protein (TIGR02001 family)